MDFLRGFVCRLSTDTNTAVNNIHFVYRFFCFRPEPDGDHVIFVSTVGGRAAAAAEETQDVLSSDR